MQRHINVLNYELVPLLLLLFYSHCRFLGGKGTWYIHHWHRKFVHYFQRLLEEEILDLMVNISLLLRSMRGKKEACYKNYQNLSMVQFGVSFSMLEINRLASCVD